MESSAAEEEVEDEERSHGEPAKISKCLKYVGFIVGVIKCHCQPAEITKCLSRVLSGCLRCIGAWGSSRDVWRIFRGVKKLLLLMENIKKLIAYFQNMAKGMIKGF